MHDRTAIASPPELARVSPVRARAAPRERAPARAEASAETPGSVRTSGVVIAAAFLLMAVFGSADLRSFARDLPESRLSDALVRGADGWHALMLDWGPARVRPTVRALFDGLREARW